MDKIVQVGTISISNTRPFVFISGPCVVESRKITLDTVQSIQKIAQRVGVPFIFKVSYDKANRTSISSFRGLGIRKGLEIIKEVRERLGLPVLSDVHTIEEIEQAAGVLDILQVPAFLCRQTDFIVNVAQTGKVVNIKKGQFLAPWDIREVIKKVESTGNKKILLTERGVSFGYNNLVSDFRSLAIMRQTGYPVVFDASHSVQQPGGLGRASGGQSEFIALLARCGVAAGCSAIFMEVHPNPKKALSDGPNTLAVNRLEPVLRDLKAIDEIVKRKIRSPREF